MAIIFSLGKILSTIIIDTNILDNQERKNISNLVKNDGVKLIHKFTKMLTSLPDEVLLQIFYPLNYSDTVSSCSICSRTRKLFNLDTLWKQKIIPLRPDCNLVDKPLYQLIKIFRSISRWGQIYSYGDNTYGQAGPWDTRVITQATPVMGFNNVIQVACGHNHTALVTADGCLYTLGNNGWGKLGIGRLGGVDGNPTLVPGFTNVLKVACGGNHTVFITTEGNLYTFGCNSENQLGVQGPAELSPQLILGFIIDIACGDNHTAVVTEDGELYIFGNNRIYRVHPANYVPEYCHPVLEISGVPCEGINPKEKVIRVACGGRHTIFTTDQGKIYSFDIYKNLPVTTSDNVGLLKSLSIIIASLTGLGLVTKILNIRYTPLNFLMGQLGLYYPVKWAFDWLRTPKELSQWGKITQVSLGSNKLAFINEGKLYINSNKSTAQARILSGSPYQDHYIPVNHKLLSLNVNESIKQVAVAGYYFVLATNSGKVYSAYEKHEELVVRGNVALGTSTNYNYQEIFTGNIIQVAAGHNHTMILARE